MPVRFRLRAPFFLDQYKIETECINFKKILFLIKLPLIITAIFCLSGCTTINYNVGLSSITAPQSEWPKGNRYIFIPDKTINPGSLEYQEYTYYLKNIFAMAGLQNVDNLKDADMVIYIVYGIGEPKEKIYSYSTPVWGKTGVSSSTTYGSLYNYGNSASYSQTTQYTPTYGVTGYTSNVGSYTLYERYLVLNAFDSRIKNKELWQAIVVSEGQSSDLRLVFPVLVTALQPYIFRNTGHELHFTISDSDDNLNKIRASNNPIPRMQ